MKACITVCIGSVCYYDPVYLVDIGDLKCVKTLCGSVAFML